MSAVAEGVLTSKSAHLLAQRVGIECHVIEGIYKVCYLHLLMKDHGIMMFTKFLYSFVTGYL